MAVQLVCVLKGVLDGNEEGSGRIAEPFLMNDGSNLPVSPLKKPCITASKWAKTSVVTILQQLHNPELHSLFIYGPQK